LRIYGIRRGLFVTAVEPVVLLYLSTPFVHVQQYHRHHCDDPRYLLSLFLKMSTDLHNAMDGLSLQALENLDKGKKLKEDADQAFKAGKFTEGMCATLVCKQRAI
jgi:hypothetical protein